MSNPGRAGPSGPRLPHRPSTQEPIWSTARLTPAQRMSTEENHASGRPFSGRCPPSGRKPIPRPRSSAWRLKLPNINAGKVAAKPAHAPALRRLFPIAQRLADKPAHILEFQLPQRPLDRKRSGPPMPANAGATHSPRQRRLRTFRNLNQRTSPVTPPRRHDPHHHVLPSDNARNHPSIAIVLKRVVLLFWHTLAHRPRP